MSKESRSARIERLPEEVQEEFENQVEELREELREKHFEEHVSEIRTQLDDDDDELHDIDIIVSSFLEVDETEYTFVRTEPLIHQQEKNFDVLIASPNKGIAVLCEVERSLIDRLPSKLSKFEGKRDVIASRGTGGIDVDDYFERVTGDIPKNYDFVLASQVVSDEELKRKCEETGLNLIAWDMASHGPTCRIRSFTVKEDPTAPFNGHTDPQLEEFIQKYLQRGVPKQDFINFMYSSSRYLKLERMALVLVNRHHRKGYDTFVYDDWKRLFGRDDVDLYNYLEEEKQTLYSNFIDYGKGCGVVDLEEDHGDLFLNEYRIKSRASKDQKKLIEEIRTKMAEERMKEDFENDVEEGEETILIELEQEHATGGYTLSDFVD
mgnify:CR=1 FL=1